MQFKKLKCQRLRAKVFDIFNSTSEDKRLPIWQTVEKAPDNPLHVLTAVLESLQPFPENADKVETIRKLIADAVQELYSEKPDKQLIAMIAINLASNGQSGKVADTMLSLMKAHDAATKERKRRKKAERELVRDKDAFMGFRKLNNKKLMVRVYDIYNRVYENHRDSPNDPDGGEVTEPLRNIVTMLASLHGPHDNWEEIEDIRKVVTEFIDARYANKPDKRLFAKSVVNLAAEGKVSCAALLWTIQVNKGEYTPSEPAEMGSV